MSALDAEQVLAVVRRAVVTVLEVEPGTVTRGSRSREDLDGLQSVGAALEHAVARL